MAAPFRQAPQSCAPRPIAHSIGWLVLVAALTCLVVLGIGWAGGQNSATVPTHTVTVAVHQGETLWSVAQRIAPGVPATAEVASIRKLNGLDVDSTLYPGELLAVPSSH